jgi:hypothetical protein
MDRRRASTYYLGMCPKCGSDHLRIRNLEGWERLMVWFTGLRKYRCRECDWKFRAADRRREPRPAPTKVRKIEPSSVYPSLAADNTRPRA